MKLQRIIVFCILFSETNLISSDFSTDEEDRVLGVKRDSLVQKHQDPNKTEITEEEQKVLLTKIKEDRKRRRENPTGIEYALRLNKKDLKKYLRERYGEEDEEDIIDCSRPTPPIAEKKSHLLGSFFGHTLCDDFFWLQDKSFFTHQKSDEKSNHKEILKIIRNETIYAEFQVKIDLSEKVGRNISLYYPKDGCSYPLNFGIYDYYYVFNDQTDTTSYHRFNKTERTDEIFLDERNIKKANPNAKIGDYYIDDDDNLLLYSLDLKGPEIYNLYFFDIKRNIKKADVLERTGQSAQFNAQKTGVFYVRLDNEGRETQFCYHAFGTPQSIDILLYKEQDPRFQLRLDSISYQDHLVLYSGNNKHEHTFLFPLKGNAPHQLIHFIEASSGIGYSLSKYVAPWVYTLIQNHETLPSGIYKTPISSPYFLRNKALSIPFNDRQHCLDYNIYDRHIVVLFIENARKYIDIYLNESSLKQHTISFSDPVHDFSVTYGSIKDPFLRINYASPLTVPSIFEYDFNTGQLFKRHQKEAIRSISDECVTKRHWINNKGVNVPVDLFYKRDLNLKKSPLYVTAYGAYGETSFITYDPYQNVLAENGFIVAVAYPRGGSECGKQWHLDAQKSLKKNTFLDVIACIEGLHANGFSSPHRTVFEGESAGGLISGYIANEKPNLVRAVFFNNPFIDVLRGGMNGDIPSVKEQWSEWGNPLESMDMYLTLKDYCPYENIKPQKYPHIVITAGLSDIRTPYWESLKYTQKVRQSRTDDGLTLCFIDPEGGHLGNSEEVSMSSDVFRLSMLLSLFKGKISI